MESRKTVAIFCGGPSVEHEVSLHSGRNIYDAIDKTKHQVFLIAIDRLGNWFLHEDANFFVNPTDPKTISINSQARKVTMWPIPQANFVRDAHTGRPLFKVDVAFPIVHGTTGEDGALQGFFKLTQIPFVGAGVLGSAVGMDKDVMKRLFEQAKIPTARHSLHFHHEKSTINYEELSSRFGLPFFVKPCNTGSSVGISKVKSLEDFSLAIDRAFQTDRKILIEEAVIGREIECAVYGNDAVQVSLPGEIVVKTDFYSYDAKYVDDDAVDLIIPVDLPKVTIDRLREMAGKIYRTLCCEGLARVDFFLKSNGEILANEINTLPGFTRSSMYPKLWNATGVTYSDLIDRLLELAFDRQEQETKLKRTL